MKTVNTMKRWFPFFLTFAAMTAAPFHPALAAVAPSLGTAESFAVLGGSTVTNTGPTIITGGLGVSPGSAVTGFPPGLVVGGTIHAADAVADGAQGDNTTAYNDLAGQASNFDLTDQDLGGLTLVPGVYTFSTSAQLTGALTLDAEGDPEAVWVFQIGSTLTTASNSSVTLINGGQACNVFWQVGSSATLGTNASFIGNILALTSISLTTDAILSGRALAQTGAVTMDSNQVAAAVCSVPPITPIPPTLGKAFGPGTIDEGGSSTLTITLSNPDAGVASNASFTDTLPSGVVVAATPNAINTCGGTLTATAGSSTVSLTGGAIPANSSCTVSVDVTAQSGGNYVNSLAAGALQTSNGPNAAPAIATLTVNSAVLAPTLGKAFDPATVDEGDPSTLTITLSNPAEVVAGNASFTDTLPSGVVVAATPNANNTCGGTLTATAGNTTVSLTGGAIPANSSCTVSVDVTAQDGGNYVNSLAAGALQTDNGPNAAPAIATLTVIPSGSIAPTLGKAFNPAAIDEGDSSTLTITLSNPDAGVASNASFTDTLPSGVVVAATPNAINTCGGTLTATAGSSTVSLTEGAIPANSSCTVSVDVTAQSGGNYVNSLAAGALQTSNGPNAAPAIATLTVNSVVLAPTLGKAFDPATVDEGDPSTLTITLSNPAEVVAGNASFTDTLPIGVVVAATPNANNTCGGTLTATAGSTTVSLTGGAIPANSSCTVSVDVTAQSGGNYVNSLAAGALQTDNGPNAAPAIATLTVIPVGPPVSIPPTLGKVFSPTTINAGGTSTLIIKLRNANSSAAILTAPLTDTLPSGLLAVAGSARTNCGGTVTVDTSRTTVTLTGGSIPANGSCRVRVIVTARSCQAAGDVVTPQNPSCNFENMLPAGALKTNKGSNVTQAVATLTVNKAASVAPKLSKSFSPATINAGGTSTLIITLRNANSSAATLTAPLTDALPSGVLVVAGSARTNCGGTVTVNRSRTTVTLTGGSIPANGSCRVRVVVTAKSCQAAGDGVTPQNPSCKYENKLLVGALKTNKGSNATHAVATLTVKIR